MNRESLKKFAKDNQIEIDFKKCPPMTKEIWKQYYNILVSNYGNVKDKATLTDIEVTRSPGGRCYVKTENGRKYVTWLVYELFYNTSRDGLEIHHIDENPSNNRADNLVAVTKSIHRKLHEKQKVSHKPFQSNSVLYNITKLIDKIDFNKFDQIVQKEIINYFIGVLDNWKTITEAEKSKYNNIEYKYYNPDKNRYKYSVEMTDDFKIITGQDLLEKTIKECLEKYGKVTRKKLFLLGVRNFDSVYVHYIKNKEKYK